MNLSECTFWGHSSHKTAFTSDTSHKFGVSRVALNSNQLATNWGVPTITLRFDTFLKRLTELSESAIIMITILLYQKATNLNQPKEKMHRVEAGTVSNVKLQMWIILRGVLPSQHQSVKIFKEYCQPGQLIWDSVSRVFTEVSLHRHDWLNYCPCDWTQSAGCFSSPEDKLSP